MDLEKEIAKISDKNIFLAYDEIKVWQNSGILKDPGIVRKMSEDFAKSTKEEDYKFHRMVSEAFLFEMATRYKAIRNGY